MKRAQSVAFSKEVLKDIGIITSQEDIKTSEWVKNFKFNFVSYIALKRASAMKKIEGKWILNRITSEEFKNLSGRYPSRSLRREKELHYKNSEKYKENARKALVMNI